jgi:hypothetical protein
MYASDPNPSRSVEEIPVFRFFSPSKGRHFFTGDPIEANSIRLTGIWNHEGIAFWGEKVG